MRVSFVLFLSLLAPVAAVGADGPIPPDAARSDKRVRDRLEWNRRTLEGAYDKVGKRDARWDRQAREAMGLAARNFGHQVDPIATRDEINRAAKAAIDAGCDDPMIFYLRVWSSTGLTPEQEAQQIRVAARGLKASGYPACRRASALAIAVAFDKHPAASPAADKKEREADMAASLALLAESVAKDERGVDWEEKWYTTLSILLGMNRKFGADPPTAYGRIDAALAKFPELKPLRLQFRGGFWVGYAWEARSNGAAASVSQAAFQAFAKRLQQGKEAYNQAWKARPGDARTAAGMMVVEKGMGGGDRAAMELWFDRAIKADPDCQDACYQKLEWLSPQWYGTSEEMLAFGKACQATGNWRAKITPLAVTAHFRQATLLEPQARSDYLNSPAVWSQIKAVNDEYLKHYPDDHAARTRYAVLADLGRHEAQALAQFRILGKDLVMWTDSPLMDLHSVEVMKTSLEFKATLEPLKD